MNVVKYEPWVLVNRLSRDLERLFAPYEGADESHSSVVDWVPAVHIKEQDKEFVLHADLPGVDPKDIEVTLEKGVLTLRGRRATESRRANWIASRRVRDGRILSPLQPARQCRFTGRQGQVRERRARDRDSETAERATAQDQRGHQLTSRRGLKPSPRGRNFPPAFSVFYALSRPPCRIRPCHRGTHP